MRKPDHVSQSQADGQLFSGRAAHPPAHHKENYIVLLPQQMRSAYDRVNVVPKTHVARILDDELSIQPEIPPKATGLGFDDSTPMVWAPVWRIDDFPCRDAVVEPNPLGHISAIHDHTFSI
jgi:hypothetical protein